MKLKNRILIAVWAVVFIFFLLLLVNFVSNEKMIKKYNEGVYEFNTLDFLGFTQPYIAPYNKGNIYYQKGSYELAIAQYDIALSKYPTRKAECDIRVNKAFCMLALIDTDYKTKDDIDPIIDQLLEVESVLTEKGCANEDFLSGHDTDAQQLFNEIDSYIDSFADVKDTFSFYGYKIYTDDNGASMQLNGNDFQFSFIEVADKDGNELDGASLVNSGNDSEGLITFNTITYKLSDAGTHFYKIYEEPGSNAQISYDTKEYVITVELTVSYNGRTLDADISHNADDSLLTSIHFNNTYNTPDSDDNQQNNNNNDNNNNNNNNDNSDNDNNSGSDGDNNDQDDQNQNNDQNEGQDQQNQGDETDEIGQQLQDYMNQANNDRYEDIYGNPSYSYYSGDCW